MGSGVFGTRQSRLFGGWAILAFLLGQALLFFQQYVLGGWLCAAGLLLAARWLLPENHRPRGEFLLALGAFSAAAVGTAVVRNTPLLGLFLYAAAGCALFFARPPAPASADWQSLPENVPARRAWEPWFVALLLVIGIFSRAYHLDRFPQGVCFHEAVMAELCQDLQRAPYTPHLEHDHANFPSLVFYEGLAAVRWLGWNAGAFRLPSALWGILSLLAFYFLARRLTSPGPAAIASLLFAASGLHLMLSRWFFPGTLLFLPPLAGLWLLLQGFRRPRPVYFFLAGGAIGLSLHGYFPGRVIPLLFLAWLLWLHVTDRRYRLSGGQWAWLAGGFLLVSAPILIYAVRHPTAYWGKFFASGSRDLAANAWSYLKTTVPIYAKLFHVWGDTDFSLRPAHLPLLDPVSGTLFALGFFLCLLRAWRPVPAFLYLLFFAGLAPALFGSQFEHPTVRRTLLVLPAVYLFAAEALERLRRVFNPGGTRVRAWLLAGAALAGAAWAGADTLHNYYYRMQDNPGARIAFNYRTFCMGEEIRAHPGARILANPESAATTGGEILFPREAVVEKVSTPEEMLVLHEQQDQLLLLNSLYEIYLPFFRREFPRAGIRVYREEAQNDPLLQTPYFLYANDPYNPRTYLVRVLIPAADIRAFHGLVDLSAPEGGRRLDCFAPDFASRHAGRNLRLGGALVLAPAGGRVTAECAWSGWSLRMDGRPVRFSEALDLDGGVHYLEIRGRVPSEGGGALPLSIRQGSLDLRAADRLVGLFSFMGLRSEYYPPQADFSRPPLRTRQELFPERRFCYLQGLPFEFTVRMQGWLTVPQDGQYDFSSKTFTFCRLRVAGQTCFDNYAERGIPRTAPVRLQANHPVPVTLESLMEVDMHTRVVQLDYAGPGQPRPAGLPPEWLTPYLRKK